MDDNKLFIDSVDLNDYEAIQLQAEKIKVAELFQAYEEIVCPRIFHKLAYRYKLDDIMDTLAVYYELLADLAHKTAELSQDLGQINLPPYIQARIDAIMAEQEQNDPNMSEAKRSVIFDSLFAPGGEFDGLFVYNSNNEPIIDETWLENYIAQSEKSGMPIQIKVEFTDDMLKDIEDIKQQNLSSSEKEERISALFSENGKYNNAVQLAYEQELEQYNQNK